MVLTTNKAILDFINQKVELCQPDRVIWIDGSEAQLEELRKEACSTGESMSLAAMTVSVASSPIFFKKASGPLSSRRAT